MSTSLRTIVPLSLALLLLISYSFMSAQSWTPAPTAGPPNSNTPAPVNVGTSTQSVQQGIGSLLFDRFAAVNSVWSDKYCNALGGSCFTATSTGDSVTMADFYTYMTNQNPMAYPESTACSCKPGELLTGCSGFQAGENDTQQLSGGRNGCYSDGTTRAKCHCMGAVTP